MESLLEGLEENRLDALYLFITDVLRDATAFRRFFANLMSVLPQNYSVHRIEAGHEFLKQIKENDEDQRRLFRSITELESLRTLIVSDGYVQRKDHGAISTRVFLQELPRAASLVNLDIHRMELKTSEEVDLLAVACETMAESLEELRLTGLFLSPAKGGNNNSINRGEDGEGAYPLDPVVEILLNFQHLRSLTLALYPNDSLHHHHHHHNINNDNNFNANGNQQPQQEVQLVRPHAASVASHEFSTRAVSSGLWYDLCQLSTLQDLTLRHMHLDDDACLHMSKALQESSFLTSLDLRQNLAIGTEGYNHISRALELNFSSWCTVSVDSSYYQSMYHVLIELNQHNRGDVVRNLNRFNLSEFVEGLETTVPNPTAVWHFLRIHDSVRNPLAAYLSWKEKRIKREQARKRKAEQQVVPIAED